MPCWVIQAQCPSHGGGLTRAATGADLTACPEANQTIGALGPHRLWLRAEDYRRLRRSRPSRPTPSRLIVAGSGTMTEISSTWMPTSG